MKNLSAEYFYGLLSGSRGSWMMMPDVNNKGCSGTVVKFSVGDVNLPLGDESGGGPPQKMMHVIASNRGVSKHVHPLLVQVVGEIGHGLPNHGAAIKETRIDVV
jgi:hypothetical protein